MNRSSSVAYIDTLTNLLLVFFLLFMLQQMKVMQEQFKKQSVETKAEIVAELEWPMNSTDDIDLHMLLPNGVRVNFTSKDSGVATLDRDDRGAWGDMYIDANGKPQVIKINKEVISIRAILPGKYVINAHYYSHISLPDVQEDPTVPANIELTFKLTDLNPTFKEVVTVKKRIQNPGDQITLVTFEVDAQGNVINVDTTSDLPFIRLIKME